MNKGMRLVDALVAQFETLIRHEFTLGVRALRRAAVHTDRTATEDRLRYIVVGTSHESLL